MHFQHFYDLPVWIEARKLANCVFDLTESDVFRSRYSLRDQLERAALSVSNNIAEGFERGTTAELLSFLYISRGSAAEVRSMSLVLQERPVFNNYTENLKEIERLSESCCKQLSAWARQQKSSPNAKGQARFESRASDKEFQSMLEKYIKQPPTD